MNDGHTTPQTGMLALNDLALMIDAQLTTEIFGALAPGMPGAALRSASSYRLSQSIQGKSPFHAAERFRYIGHWSPLAVFHSPHLHFGVEVMRAAEDESSLLSMKFYSALTAVAQEACSHPGLCA